MEQQISLLVLVNGKDAEFTVPSLEDFVAEKFCGEFFYRERPEVARSIAKKMIEVRGRELTFQAATEDVTYEVVVEG
jgi:hypothetical protein